MNANACTLFGAIFIVLLVMVGGCTSTQPVTTPTPTPVYNVVAPTPTPPPVDPIVGYYDATNTPVGCSVAFYASNTGHIDCGFFAQRDFNWYAQPTKGHYQVELEGSMYSGTLEPNGDVWSTALPSGTHLQRKVKA